MRRVVLVGSYLYVRGSNRARFVHPKYQGREPGKQLWNAKVNTILSSLGRRFDLEACYRIDSADQYT